MPIHLLCHFILPLYQKVLNIKIGRKVSRSNQRYLKVVFMHGQKANIIVKKLPRFRVVTEIRVLISPVSCVIYHKVMAIGCKIRQKVFLFLSRLLVRILLFQGWDQPIVKNESPEPVQDNEKYGYNEVFLEEQAQISFFLHSEPVLSVF